MVVYIIKFFPKLSEAFILDELIEMKKAGVPFAVWALGRWKDDSARAGAEEVLDRVTYLSDRSAGKAAKAIALTGLWARGPSRTGEAYRLFNGPLKDRFHYTFTQSMPRVARLLRAGATHIHAHFANEAADHAVCLSLLSGIPFSFTVHGSDLLVEPHPHLSFLAERASAVLTPSRFNADHMTREFGIAPRKIHVVPNGVDAARFSPGERAKKTGGKILTVARLEPVKALHHLVDACALLKEKGVSFRTEIIGDGSQRDALAARIDRQGLTGVVELAGDLPREEVSRRLKSAEIFALSSRSEGLPVAVLEAMSCALPVVAPRITGMGELVEHEETGLLVEPESASLLAEALAALLADGALRAKLGAAARHRVLARFSLPAIVERRREIFFGPREAGEEPDHD